MEQSAKIHFFITPPVCYIKLGFFRTLRIMSKPATRIVEKRWFKIDKDNNTFELEGHDKDSLWLGPVSDSDYGQYYCEVKIEGEDSFIKTESAHVMHPDSKPLSVVVETIEKSKSYLTEIPTHYVQHTESRNSDNSSTCTSPNISPAHPYYRGFMTQRTKSVSSPLPRTPDIIRPASVIPSDTQTGRKLSDIRDNVPEPPSYRSELAPISPETGNSSSSSYLTHEDSFRLPDLPKIRPMRMIRRDSTFSSESDIFHDVTQLTSTPITHSDTPEWSLASTGYPMASPSLNYSFSSSLPPSPASKLRDTFFEMATLPRRSSMSPQSSRSEPLPRPHFKNEQEFRLVGYQQTASPAPTTTDKPRPGSVISHFRFTLSSTSKFCEDS